MNRMTYVKGEMQFFDGFSIKQEPTLFFFIDVEALFLKNCFTDSRFSFPYSTFFPFSGPYEYVSFEDLLSQSDFLIICVAQTQETIGKFDKDILYKMKKDSILINTSR